MHYPHFYDQVAPITLYDPLSDFLGAIKKGEMRISYLDCVKLAGHSCPTVAGAYLMAQEGLKVLYPNAVPQRGSVKVEMKNREDEGVTGVICNVLSFIIGANGIGGFKGIQGNFSRDNLQDYAVDMQGEVRLTCLNNNESITLQYNPSIVPPDARLKALMVKTLNNGASKEEIDTFKQLWQQRVEQILLHTDPTQLVTITKD